MLKKHYIATATMLFGLGGCFKGGGFLTQNQGANTNPACSPDGRLVSFFSTRKTDKGPGLYIAPIAAPWRAKQILAGAGEGLRWEAIPQ